MLLWQKEESGEEGLHCILWTLLCLYPCSRVSRVTTNIVATVYSFHGLNLAILYYRVWNLYWMYILLLPVIFEVDRCLGIHTNFMLPYCTFYVVVSPVLNYDFFR
jgi:hypothetical protein